MEDLHELWWARDIFDLAEFVEAGPAVMPPSVLEYVHWLCISLESICLDVQDNQSSVRIRLPNFDGRV